MVMIENCLYGLIYGSFSLIVLILLYKVLKRAKIKVIRPKYSRVALDNKMLGCAALYRLGQDKELRDIDSLIRFVDTQHDQLEFYIIENGYLIHLESGDQFLI